MNQIMLKGLDALINDDPSLREKITYENYKDGKNVPGNSDDHIEDVYADYRSYIEKGSTE